MRTGLTAVACESNRFAVGCDDLIHAGSAFIPADRPPPVGVSRLRYRADAYAPRKLIFVSSLYARWCAIGMHVRLN